MAQFEVRLTTMVPVTFGVIVEAPDGDAAEKVALAHAFSGDDDPCAKAAGVIANEWQGPTDNLSIDWQSNGDVTVEDVDELIVEDPMQAVPA
jgi:hypothetical protein